MSRQSVRDYITGILQAGTHDIAIEPSFPKAEGIQDIVFIQAITSTEQRATMPRGGGRKTIDYSLNMMAMSANDDELLVPQQMDVLLEQVFEVLRSTPLNVIITDTDTGKTGQVMKVGETIRVTSDVVFQLMSTQGNEAQVVESVGFTFDMQELVQA